MAFNYPSARVGVPVDVLAEALYLRKEEDGETSVCFVTREDVLVPKGTVVRVDVNALSASAARAIMQHLTGQLGTSMDFQLKKREFAEAARTIADIVEEDDARTKSLGLEAAAAKLRSVR